MLATNLQSKTNKIRCYLLIDYIHTVHGIRKHNFKTQTCIYFST